VTHQWNQASLQGRGLDVFDSSASLVCVCVCTCSESQSGTAACREANGRRSNFDLDVSRSRSSWTDDRMAKIRQTQSLRSWLTAG